MQHSTNGQYSRLICDVGAANQNQQRKIPKTPKTLAIVNYPQKSQQQYLLFEKQEHTPLYRKYKLLRQATEEAEI